MRSLAQPSQDYRLARSQLGQYLDGLSCQLTEEIGRFPNGVPYFRRAGPFTVGERDIHAYRHLPGIAPRWATIRSIFHGPSGLTAEADVEEGTGNRAHRFPLDCPDESPAEPMTITITLQLEAKALAANLDGTPDALLALTHRGYRYWTKARACISHRRGPKRCCWRSCASVQTQTYWSAPRP
jgi:hypothetical protein